MAVSTTHGVTVETMIGSLPFAAGTITPTSDGLRTTDLQAWIDEAAGQCNALLVRHHIHITTLSGDTVELVRAGIRAYVTARALSHRHFPQEQIAREWEQWNSVRKTLREDPQSLGNDQVASNQVVSNVDTANPTRSRFDRDQDLF